MIPASMIVKGIFNMIFFTTLFFVLYYYFKNGRGKRGGRRGRKH